MKFFKNIFNNSKAKTLVLAGIIAVGTGFGIGAVQAEFYPDRQPFDYSIPCDATDSNIYDRCGSLTGPVFNSFINTPSYGDERAFADARRSDQTAAGSYENVLPDVNKGVKEVVIRTYVHNNANQSTNASGQGIATGTKVRIDLPEANSNVLRARSYISADNAALVEDTVDLTGTENFRVEYVPGSAKLYNNTAYSGGVALSDSIVTTGALIGDDALDGELPGCFEYESTVLITVKIITENPNIDFQKEVRKKGESDWKETVTAKPGETVQWLLTTKNTGDSQLDEINVRDVLPPHVELVSGTVRRVDASRDQNLQNGPLFSGGYVVGSYGAGSGVYVLFDTKVLDNFETCEVRVRNQAFVSSKQSEERGDTADLVIKKDNCNEETPVYACTNLTLVKLADNKFKFTTTAQAENGATVKQYTYNYGDDTQEVVTDKNMVEHSYAKPGTYVVTADVTFNVGNQMATDSDNPKCVVKVSYDVKGTTTPPAPTTPTVIPNTGAGSTIAGLLAAVTVAGAVAHRAFTLKRS